VKSNLSSVFGEQIPQKTVKNRIQMLAALLICTEQIITGSITIFPGSYGYTLLVAQHRRERGR